MFINNTAPVLNTTLYSVVCLVYETAVKRQMRYSLKTKTPINHEDARREYLKRTVVLVGVFLGFVPGVLLVSTFGKFIGFPELGGIAGIAGMLAFVGSILWHNNWRCPRCKKTFFWKWWRGNAFASKCVHCRFSPFSSGDQK